MRMIPSFSDDVIGFLALQHYLFDNPLDRFLETQSKAGYSRRIPPVSANIELVLAEIGELATHILEQL